MADTFFYEKPVAEYFSSYSTSFTAGVATLDIQATLGKQGSYVEFFNDGAGDYIATMSNNGTDYGNNILVKAGEVKGYFYKISSVEITYLTADTAYRVEAV